MTRARGTKLEVPPNAAILRGYDFCGVPALFSTSPLPPFRFSASPPQPVYARPRPRIMSFPAPLALGRLFAFSRRGESSRASAVNGPFPNSFFPAARRRSKKRREYFPIRTVPRPTQIRREEEERNDNEAHERKARIRFHAKPRTHGPLHPRSEHHGYVPVCESARRREPVSLDPLAFASLSGPAGSLLSLSPSVRAAHCSIARKRRGPQRRARLYSSLSIIRPASSAALLFLSPLPPPPRSTRRPPCGISLTRAQQPLFVSGRARLSLFSIRASSCPIMRRGGRRAEIPPPPSNYIPVARVAAQIFFISILPARGLSDGLFVPEARIELCGVMNR